MYRGVMCQDKRIEISLLGGAAERDHKRLGVRERRNLWVSGEPGDTSGSEIRDVPEGTEQELESGPLEQGERGKQQKRANEWWLRLKGNAQRTLQDELYARLRKQGPVEVEPVFGQLKGNQGYRRFLLRGMEKVSTEWGLLALGYNVKQMYRKKNQKPA